MVDVRGWVVWRCAARRCAGPAFCRVSSASGATTPRYVTHHHGLQGQSAVIVITQRVLTGCVRVCVRTECERGTHGTPPPPSPPRETKGTTHLAQPLSDGAVAQGSALVVGERLGAHGARILGVAAHFYFFFWRLSHAEQTRSAITEKALGLSLFACRVCACVCASVEKALSQSRVVAHKYTHARPQAHPLIYVRRRLLIGNRRAVRARVFFIVLFFDRERVH